MIGCLFSVCLVACGSTCPSVLRVSDSDSVCDLGGGGHYIFVSFTFYVLLLHFIMYSVLRSKMRQLAQLAGNIRVLFAVECWTFDV